MRRKRRHIPVIELLASALADKLPTIERMFYIEKRATARQIVKLFTPDHIKLHAWGGEDKWWNLDMRRRGAELKAKDRADTSRAAKTVRIDEQWGDFIRRTAAGKKPRKQTSRWPSRPFPQRRRRR